MEDDLLVARLRSGEEAAFRELVLRYGGRLQRLARVHTRNDALIDEAVQETWLAVFRGVQGYAGRAPFRAWLFAILVNQARRAAAREKRHAHPEFRDEALDPADADTSAGFAETPAMGADGAWLEPPPAWGTQDPAHILQEREGLKVIERELEALPPRQRQVVLLRDVEGLSPEAVCNILELTDTHQRVLLHRARMRIRAALGRWIQDAGGTPRPSNRQRT
jgi:RNA polymerase sigma-70 factor (ECF subfamily)